MARRKKTPLSKMLIASMKEAVAISEGQLEAPRRHLVATARPTKAPRRTA